MRYPAIDPEELSALQARFGECRVDVVDLDVDEELYLTRISKIEDRRSEVVFAVKGPGGGVMVHRKSFWEEGTFRLPSGGVNPDELVIDALHRELREETTLRAEPDGIQLVGVQDCHLRYCGDAVRFVSYVFVVSRTLGTLRAQIAESIEEFQEVGPSELAEVAERLRAMPAPYAGWGRWRAVAHDLVREYLTRETTNS